MTTIPNSTLSAARDARLDDLSPVPGVVTLLKQLHYLVLSVCPDCLIQQREDQGLIYVPPKRRSAGRDKNHLTMWAEKSGVRMRIMPEPEEMYDPGSRAVYLSRLLRLYDEMLDRDK